MNGLFIDSICNLVRTFDARFKKIKIVNPVNIYPLIKVITTSIFQRKIFPQVIKKPYKNPTRSFYKSITHLTFFIPLCGEKKRGI